MHRPAAISKEYKNSLASIVYQKRIQSLQKARKAILKTKRNTIIKKAMDLSHRCGVKIMMAVHDPSTGEVQVLRQKNDDRNLKMAELMELLQNSTVLKSTTIGD